MDTAFLFKLIYTQFSFLKKKGVAQAGFLRYVSDDTLASPVLKTIGEVEIRF